jgi:hypothetical protein
VTGHRTVTVPTRDAGLVTIPEPAWCLGDHPAGGHGVDITHSGPETALAIDTGHGPVVIARACIEQRPFTEQTPPGTGPFVAVELAGSWYPCGPTTLRRIADQIAEQASDLRALAEVAAALGAGPIGKDTRDGSQPTAGESTQSDPGCERCPAAHPADPTPCDGPTVVTVLDAHNAGADGCAHHAARLLASLEGGRVYGLPDAPEGAAIEVYSRAQHIPPFAWLAGGEQ